MSTPPPPTVDPRAFSSPDKFSFEAKDWTQWKTRFERFRGLSNLKNESEEYQVNALLYSMGDKADDILKSLSLSATDAIIYQKVLDAFEAHFVGKRNVVYERAVFGLRNQESGETFDSFLTSLYVLSEHCGYGSLKDDLIRDRIVLGVTDKSLSEKLMLNGNLTLSKAIDMAKHWEAVKKQQGDLQGGSKSLDAMKKKTPPASSSSSSFQKRKPMTQTDKTTDVRDKQKCKFCGYTHEFKKGKCPAAGQTCRQCNEIGHFSQCCKKKAVSTTTTKKVNRVQTSLEPTFMMGTLQYFDSMESRDRSQRWSANILVDEKSIEFKLDPGADVTGIPYHIFRKNWRQRKIFPANHRLTGPDGGELTVVGTVTCKLKNKEMSVSETVFVIKGLERPLLGLKACEDLKFVQRINNIVEKALTMLEPKKEFPLLFSGLGKIDQPYTIKLRDDARPVAIYTPRRVAIPLLGKVKEKLDEMIAMDIIEAVDEPTEWCAPLVTAPKPGGDIRICVDLTALNRYVVRELHCMPVVEHTLGQLAGARIFSKLDANSGFYQILLSPECRSLTTFITPFGRFRYRRLPFGISSGPEHFQKRMSEILLGLPGVVIHIDDLLIFGADTKEHDERLRAVMNKLKIAGVTLNYSKCVFGVTTVKFLGHIVNADGVCPDPQKVEAITEMRPPENVVEVRSFMGLTNFLARYVPHLSTISRPLYDLTKGANQFMWGPSQQTAFDKIKKVLTEAPVLALYDPNKETMISSDASSFGIGAVLLQKQADGKLKPVAYASRTMTESEQRYAQIEKEALGITWSCDRFRDFLLGKEFVIETDHKPLLPILTTKCLDDLSPRLQRFRIRLMWFTYTVVYTPGKNLVTADCLSRKPLRTVGKGDLEDEITAFVCHAVSQIPASDEKLSEIWQAQQNDETIQKVMKYCISAWPAKSSVLEPSVRNFWNVRDTLTTQNGLLMKDTRLVIPKCLQNEMLGRIHEGHLGVVKCRARARSSCWWPGQSDEIAEIVRRCPTCVQERIERKEPMIPSEFPTRPWQKLGMDLFKLNGRWFIVVVDYYSRYPEVIELNSMTTEAVVNVLKMIFSRHGVPEEVMSDNGPQFHPLKTSPFRKFAQEYGFIHRTSSPRYPQSNGFVENAVKIMKNLMKKNADWFKALLEYRASPLSNGFSPSELLMGRRIRSTLPTATSNLTEFVDRSALPLNEDKRREKQKNDYDKRHGVRVKDDFMPGDVVWIKDLRIWGTVVDSAGTPRSYRVDTPRGEFRRNSSHLTPGRTSAVVHMNPDFDDSDDNDAEAAPVPVLNTPGPQKIRTRSGRAVNPRRRLIEEI